MQKPEGYETTEAKMAGEFEQMPAGAYVTKIIKAEVKPTKTGKEMLVLSLDISEGEYENNYSEMSDRLQKDIYLNVYQLTEGASLPFFKGLIKVIEESNPPFKFNFDESKLVGKRIGVNLREEEYLHNGEIKSGLRVGQTVTVNEARGGLPTLKKKTLAQMPSRAASVSSPAGPQNAPTPTSDDCPF